MKPLACCLGIALLEIAASSSARADNTISATGDTIRLRAGMLEKSIRLAGGTIRSESLTVAGAPLGSADAGELSFRLARATPDRNPLDSLTIDTAAALRIAEAKADGTDSLDVHGGGAAKPAPAGGQVEWTEARSFSARTWAPCFDLANHAITVPAPGVQRLVIRARSLADPLLAGVSVHLIYEVYDGYPVVRKWLEIHNNSSHWLKLDQLVIDDPQFTPEFHSRTELTPSERGAAASIVAFSSADRTKGVIVASEVPSALRTMGERGATGYSAGDFEWVLGPAEDFVSEPVFIYGFSGEVVTTVSAESLPLDRAVEGGFKQFLRERLGLSPLKSQLPAPMWATWSNFGPAVTADIVAQQADLAARCGFALFELDDGWQQGRLGINPNETTFPRFAETCDAIRAKGMRLGLWVSCFRDRDAADFKALPNAASAPEVRRLDGLAMGFTGSWARYFAHDLLLLRDRYGATYFKQDFSNLKFGDLAPGHASRTRKESLLRGLRGLLETQSILRRLAPDVANQISHEIYWGTPGVPCDLAALKHAALYHIPPNDYSGACIPGRNDRPGASAAWTKLSGPAMQAQLLQGCLNARSRLYAHRGLPLECIEYYAAATVNWQGSLTPQIQDRQICSWLMGAPLVFSGDLATLTDDNITRYRSRFELLKRLEERYGIYRHFQSSGVPAPTDTDWHWWGKLDAAGCGVVVVLRGSQGAPQRAINIPWVDPNKIYQVRTLFQDGSPRQFTGARLQAGDLTLALPAYGQELIELSETITP